MKKITFLFLIVLVSEIGLAQRCETITPAFWKLTSINGEFNVKSLYQREKTTRNNFQDQLNNSITTGELLINTRSFFYHPNFFVLNVDAGYSPEIGKQKYVISPNQYAVTTLKKLNINATLFQCFSFKANLHANFNENYSNRENLTNLKTSAKNLGGSLGYSNKILPLYGSFSNSKIKTTELEDGRVYTTENKHIDVRTEKNFGDNFWNELQFSLNDYAYNDNLLSTNINGLSSIISNKITSLNLTNRIYFDTKRNYSFNSMILSEEQVGNFNLKRYQTNETLFFKLPGHFNLRGNYNYNYNKGDVITTTQHNAVGELSQRLYKSLFTRISYEYNTTFATDYTETINRGSAQMRYLKKIPLNGQLNLSYTISNNIQNHDSESLFVTIQNENHTLLDTEMILLVNQNITLPTIVVKDITGTIIYTLNIDYVLINRNGLIEIQRIPGGQIANNTPVLVDYVAVQPQSYHYNAINHNLTASLSFFKNKIEFYYNFFKQDFIDQENIDNLVLDYFNRDVYGSRLNFKFLSGGIEFDHNKSTIIPYTLTRYFITLQGNFRKNLLFSLNGDIQDYSMIINEGQTQKFYNFSGNLIYNLSPITKLQFQGGYRNQQGVGIDLNLLNAKFELSTQFRKLFITTGIELYNTKVFSETINFSQVTAKISRKF